MVNIRLIQKSVDEAISKCGQRLTVNSNVKSAFSICRSETCNPEKPRKTEKGYLITENGEIVHTQSGTKNHVNYDNDKLLELYEEYGELHIEHNHPLQVIKDFPVFLSGNDVSALIKSKRELETDGVYADDNYLFKSITCEGANGTRMTMVRGDNFTNKDASNIVNSRVLDRFNQDINKVYKDLNKKINERYYQIRDEEKEKHKGETITREMIDGWLDTAIKEATSEGIDLTDTFSKYQKEFREYNLKLSWESGL